jgi:glycosyltransferase involved in cell wall biosynthesis
MNGISIAAIVPVYNRATSMLATLDSIAGQSLMPRRLIVVDDGSRDGSAESVERWIADRRPPCETRVIRQANGGVSSARNHGMRAAADCDWFAFLDSDDVWPGDFLARAAAVLAREPQAAIATADRLYVEHETGAERPFDMRPLAEAPALWMLRWGAAVCSCSVVRADLVRELGGFPQHLPTGEDAALFLPLSLCGTWLHLPGEPVTFVRRGPQPGGEEASLSRKFTDNQRRWARVYDSFFRRLTRRQRNQIGQRKRVGRMMSDRWRRAAEELEQHGQFLAAAECYVQSVRWRPTKWERWQPLLRMPLTALSGPTRRAA